MQTADRAIIRLFNDIAEARAEFTALRVLENEKLYTGFFEFFSIAYRAIFNSMILHVTRVFDEHPGTASFWYLRKVEPQMVARHLGKAKLRMRFVRKMSKSLSFVRNKTHAHADVVAVHDPRAVWKNAGIKGTDFKKWVDGAYETLEGCYYERHRTKFVQLGYDGEDIRKLVEVARKASLILS